MKEEEVLSKNENRLMSIPGVNGVGISESNGQIVISVMVKSLTPELKAQLPKDLDGVPVKVDVIGEVNAF
jgi:hypothetical protein